jgi:Mlc titration factor MtfA (ptsG expression regulator)
MFAFLFKNRRRQKLLKQQPPGQLRRIVERNLAVHSRLKAAEQLRLMQLVQVIVAERSFVGCNDLAITDEIKVTIAAQAALLLLGEEGYYFDRVPTIYVHPHYQTGRSARDLGGATLVEEGIPIEGQALEQGEIRLAWDEVVYGGRDPADGENVVLHEFAHHLDGLDGGVDGIPPLATKDQRRHWLEVFNRELEELRRNLAVGHESFLHGAAAENRAELFAYSTECFFEQPHELAELHAELFDCLRGFYKLDPRSWFEADDQFEADGEMGGRRDGEI